MEWDTERWRETRRDGESGNNGGNVIPDENKIDKQRHNEKEMTTYRGKKIHRDRQAGHARDNMKERG